MRLKDTIWCDGCGIELLWAPVRGNQRDYCCEDCKNGFACSCGSRMEEEDYPRSGRASAEQNLPYEMTL